MFRPIHSRYVSNSTLVSARFSRRKPLMKAALEMKRPDIYHPNSVQFKTRSLESKVERKNEIHMAPTYDKEEHLNAQSAFTGGKMRHDKAVNHVVVLQNELSEALEELEAIRHHTKSQLEDSSFYSALKCMDALVAHIPYSSAELPSFLSPCPINIGDVVDASLVGLVDAVNWHEIISAPFNVRLRSQAAARGDDRSVHANCRIAVILDHGLVYTHFADTNRRALLRTPKVVLEVTSEEGSSNIFKFAEGLEPSDAHQRHFHSV